MGEKRLRSIENVQGRVSEHERVETVQITQNAPAMKNTGTLHAEDIPHILEAWGFKAGKILPQRDAFKVHTAQGVFALKAVSESSKTLRFYESVLHYAHFHGFTNFAPYIRTSKGKIGAKFNGQRVLLMPWIDGREIHYHSEREMVAAVETLAHFHRATRGYEPAEGLKLKEKCGKWLKRLEERADEVEYYTLLAMEKNDEFSRVFSKYGSWVETHAAEAVEALAESEVYHRRVLQNRSSVEICHGDPAKRNFILAKNGEMYLIDFESINADLAVIDLWQLFHRMLSRDLWDLKRVKKMLSAYTAINPLGVADLEILAIFLTFPQKLWRLLHAYYEGGGQWAGYSEKEIIKLLRHFLAQRESREHFLAAFRKEYLTNPTEKGGAT